MKNYGVDNPFNSKEIIQKARSTFLKNYFDKNSDKYKKLINKRNNTNLIKYGVKNPSQNIDIKNKIKDKHIENYKDKNSSKYIELVNKRKENSQIKYGTDYPQQSPIIQEKIQNNSVKFKKYKFPSGNIRNVQGYEPFALDELIKIYKEEEIITDRKDIPRIQYELNNKNKYYFPDIYIPKDNLIIEVKSTWTYNKWNNINILKSDASKKSGYNYEFWIYNYKKEKEIIKYS
jgi:hypothetical protein